jgi:hypothetical protein
VRDLETQKARSVKEGEGEGEGEGERGIEGRENKYEKRC